MNYQLDDNAKKDLTLFLEEYVSELPHLRRGFDEPRDMVDLARRMVEKGAWGKFARYALCIWNNSSEDGMTAWLITDPQRFCYLVHKSEVWKS